MTPSEGNADDHSRTRNERSTNPRNRVRMHFALAPEPGAEARSSSQRPRSLLLLS